MSSFAFLVLCIQACLIQYNCANPIASIKPCGPAAPKIPSLLPAVILSDNRFEAYEGYGAGNVVVSGDVGIKGTTRLTGTVPVLGLVKFNGKVYAYGKATTSGKCGCGCA
ncbi:chorion class A protein Ld2/Ld41-like [Hyposmocoma kahamanoa]|uniref:chorion class A protein Ld2/Ld41-like n=1 Tax=Hyposmocoma kahamanoa TaxID=1477025 RepID=UPI000E6D7005|nr:chorion class A protein Ld2/Ld41-like [Hyposmocoma kahamanoa]